MAHRVVARPARYQGGASFNVFSAQGSNPTGDCKVTGKGVQKIYDKSVKTYVYSLCGGPTSKLQLPKDDNKTGLQLLQPFLVFQIFIPPSQLLAFELRVSDTSNTRRKMYFSTSFSDIKSTPLHAQIPISMVTRNIWLSLSIHVAELFAHCFKGMVFKSVDTILLGPVCKLRKIFTMRNRLSDVGNSFDMNSGDYLPQEHIFALGVDNVIQVLDIVALQTTISGLSDPSHSTEEDTLKLQKIKLNKLESRQVHVAFGSRMPLPLSTVQINTSLPGDNKSHSNKVFLKEQERVDRVNQTNHSQIDMPILGSRQNRVENKLEKRSETLQNLLKHANNFNKNHAMMRLRKDQTSLDPRFKLDLKPMYELAENSQNIHLTNHKFQLPSHFNITNSFKKMQKLEDVGIMALTSLTRDDMMNMRSKEDPSIPNLRFSTNEVCHKQMLQSSLVDDEVSNGDALEKNTILCRKADVIEVSACSTTKSMSMEANINSAEDSLAHDSKIIDEYKLSDPTMGLGRYVRKGPHGDILKRKETKQNKYMDISPPESPPCGWTSCTEDENEEKPLKIPSFFSKLVDGMDALEWSEDSIGMESTISGNSHVMDFSHLNDEGGNDAQSIEDDIQRFLRDEDAKIDHFPRVLMKGVVGSTSKHVDNLKKDQQRPPRVRHEKIDLENDDNFKFNDSKITGAMSDEDYSIGRHSWSSNEHSQREEDTRSSKISYVTSQERLNTSQDNDERNVDDSVNHSFNNSNKHIYGHNSIEFGNIVRDDCIENLRQSPIVTRPQSKTLYKDETISRCDEDAQKEMLTSSLDSIDSYSKPSTSSFTLENEQENIKEVEISNCIVEQEDAGITINNGRPNEDLDLLYDPTLECYYDPKTNRYYELK